MKNSEVRMLDIRRILCPIDFSDTSQHAFAHAVTIGQWYGAHITALHVGSPTIALSPAPWFTESQTDVLLGTPNRRELEDQARKWLSAAGTARLDTDVTIDTDEGSPAACILEASDQRQIRS
jgi:nucleotide-binding universal stress UspA family protein